jgi:outer membrane protein OmpU
MNNFKKVGLTALAGSLIATSAFAGEMAVTGSASIETKNNSGTDGGKGWAMGNQLTFSGSGELDNGLNVALSFVIDQGDDTAASSGPFDSHSITVSSDELGSLKFSGEGGSSAQSALDTTAAGDIWDNGFGISSPSASDAGDNSMLYTLPSLMDDLTLKAGYSPGRAGQDGATSWSATYAGVDGLSVSYGFGEDATIGSEADVTTMKGSYAMGSFTVAASQTEYDSDAGNDDEVSSYKLSYTVSEDISISYGAETHETEGSATDEEVSAITASYTTGGMTVTVGSYDAEGVDHTAGTAGDKERWKVAASFAF